MNFRKLFLSVTTVSFALCVFADEHKTEAVADDVIKAQNTALSFATEGKGFGPQSPRDISAKAGKMPEPSLQRLLIRT